MQKLLTPEIAIDEKSDLDAFIGFHSYEVAIRFSHELLNQFDMIATCLESPSDLQADIAGRYIVRLNHRDGKAIGQELAKHCSHKIRWYDRTGKLSQSLVASLGCIANRFRYEVSGTIAA
jgi:hypothetical protein